MTTAPASTASTSATSATAPSPLDHHARQVALADIENGLGAEVIAVFLGDKFGAASGLSLSTIARIPRHLRALGQCDHLALVLYTRGGDISVPGPLAAWLRSQCDALTLVVPFHCQSAGTLLALACDSIVMTEYATLSPLRPSVSSLFGPTTQSGQPPIAVEDVEAFMRFCNIHLGDGSRYALDQLCAHISPLALGSIWKIGEEIVDLAHSLISMRAVDANVDLASVLTSRVGTHDRLLPRQVAMDLGLPIVRSPEVEAAAWEYYCASAGDLALDVPHVGATAASPLPVAIIETRRTCDVLLQGRLEPTEGAASNVNQWWANVDADVGHA